MGIHCIVIPAFLDFFRFFKAKHFLEKFGKKEKREKEKRKARMEGGKNSSTHRCLFFYKGKYYFQNQYIKITIPAFLPLLPSKFKSTHERYYLPKKSHKLEENLDLSFLFSKWFLLSKTNKGLTAKQRGTWFAGAAH